MHYSSHSSTRHEEAKQVGSKDFSECIHKITELPELFVQKLLEPEFVPFNIYDDCKKTVELALKGYCTALELKYTSEPSKSSNNDDSVNGKTTPRSRSYDITMSESETATKKLINGIMWAIGFYLLVLVAFGSALFYFCFKKEESEVILEVDKEKTKKQPNVSGVERDSERGIPVSEPESVVFNQSSMYPGLYSRAQPHSQPQEQRPSVTLQFKKNIS